MDDVALARVLHVVAVVLWIGGVAMVTTVILPAIRKMKTAEERVDAFDEIEGRFAIQARITTLIAGLTGFYMLYAMDAWDRYWQVQFWWVHAMTLVWVLFTLVLFVLEPLVLKRLFLKYGRTNPTKTFVIIHRAHWILLVISLITMAGAVAGSHGWLF